MRSNLKENRLTTYCGADDIETEIGVQRYFEDLRFVQIGVQRYYLYFSYSYHLLGSVCQGTLSNCVFVQIGVQRYQFDFSTSYVRELAAFVQEELNQLI